jgi:gas vesicle protein
MSHHRSGTLLALLVGGAIGAGLALIFAPDSGAATRQRIRDSVDDAGDWATDAYDDARNKVTESTEKVKQIATDRKDDVVSAFEAGREAFYRGKERLAKES